ncbi:uncharacterized protein H6S33_006895 [Morchella sextelata]|uniref:uncharacterized protein n=1 Tax=Morchella sextelata TaxID=1174677 RepID=UPI001D04B56E|nr:uncharacterized protein H6S33_006895 [Morchella sextelata]KAH0604518.1 hypothetical protein H6S33_006895 [Morchella sextelata]
MDERSSEFPAGKRKKPHTHPPPRDIYVSGWERQDTLIVMRLERAPQLPPRSVLPVARWTSHACGFRSMCLWLSYQYGHKYGRDSLVLLESPKGADGCFPPQIFQLWGIWIKFVPRGSSKSTCINASIKL